METEVCTHFEKHLKDTEALTEMCHPQKLRLRYSSTRGSIIPPWLHKAQGDSIPRTTALSNTHVLCHHKATTCPLLEEQTKNPSLGQVKVLLESDLELW